MPKVNPDWIKQFGRPVKKEEPAPKPKLVSMPKVCKKHKATTYGNVPCTKCLEKIKTFRERPRILSYLKHASDFCKHTGSVLMGFDPDFQFVIEHEWREVFCLSPGIVKVMAEKLEHKNEHESKSKG